jgi:hypothetical protein
MLPQSTRWWLVPPSLVTILRVQVGKSQRLQAVQLTRWDLSRADFAALNLAIVEHDWSYFENECIEAISSKFIRDINSLLSIHIPTKTFFLRPRDKPWMNSEIRRNIRIRNRLHKQLKRQDPLNKYLLSKFTMQRKLVKSLIQKAKRN